MELERPTFEVRGQDIRDLGIEVNPAHLRKALKRWPSLQGQRLYRRALLLALTEQHPKLRREALQLGTDRKSDHRAFELNSELLLLTAHY
jgi:hypothetical protein